MSVDGAKIYFVLPVLGGIPVTQTMLSSFLVMLLLCIAGYRLGRNLKKRPGSVQVLTEKAVSSLYNLVSDTMGALTFIPYGTMVDHFQHIVYEKPEMTPAERHAVWKELLGVYMPWMKLDGEIPFYSEGMGWQRQHHIYSSPFYYIDYCLAQTVALEFWAMIRKDVGNAWQHYMAYTVQGGSRTFTDLLKNAGLESPFDEACLRGVCAEAEKALADFDLTGIE